MDGAHLDTSHAIDAVFGMDNDLVVQFIETGDWADLDTVGELAAVTLLGHYMRHMISMVELRLKPGAVSYR
jgi:hypothetical protein